MNYRIRRQLSNDEQMQLAPFSPMVAHLLFHRGISSAEAAQTFLEPNYDEQVHDPFLLKDAQKAAERFVLAVKSGQKIIIYTDYDADGIPGATLFNDFMRRIGYANYEIYIPHRHDEGFGLHEDAVVKLAEQGANLLITVDCGITDVAAVAKASSLGLDVIITDHHEPPPELPPAFAILDHKQLGCNYPDKNLCGSAMAYKFIQAILKIDRFGLKEGTEKWLLDMVGIATLSDMVPLVGENRVFAHFGLQVLRKSPRKGLVRLLNNLKIQQKYLTEDDIAFMITPRINAASRMGVPMDAFRLLSAETDEDARYYTDHLNDINNERKGIVASLVKEVKKIVNDRHGKLVPSVIVLGNPQWRPSLLGLAANSCAQEFNRPVFLWGYDGEKEIKGSCRSEGKTHVLELMRAVPEGVFTHFGGHKHSGGFGVIGDSVHYLEQRLNDAMESIIHASNLKSDGLVSAENSDTENAIDAELNLDAVNWSVYKEVASLAPFGKGNAKPRFLFRQVSPVLVRTFGKGSEHVELVFAKVSGEKISAISFFGAETEWAKKCQPRKPVDLVACLEKSLFRGRTELRLRIEAVHFV